MKDSCKKSLLMKDKEVKIIPNPIDTKLFRPINKISARKSLDVEIKKVILFGSIDGGKDQERSWSFIWVLNF